MDDFKPTTELFAEPAPVMGQHLHVHIHDSWGPQIMASVARIQEQMAEIATNQAESGAEVGRIREVLVQLRADFENQRLNGATPEQLDQFEQTLATLIGDSQKVEDDLKGTA